MAEIGYPAIELVYGRTGGLTHSRQKKTCDEIGLRVVALHCFFDEIEDQLDPLIEAAEQYEVEYVVCAWMDPKHRASAASYRSAADALGAAGARMQTRGLQLAYHHHDFELADVDGRRGIDYIWDVDAELLKAEVDTYWVHVAGLDIVDYLHALGDRLALLHCKDRMHPNEQPLSPPGEGLARYNREVGEGLIDFPPILVAAARARWLITEQDFSADPFEAAATSLRNLRRMIAAAVPG